MAFEPATIMDARFEANLDITASSEDDFIRFAVHFLRNHGYEVVPPNEKWETPKEFNNRLHLCKHGLSRALNKYNHPVCAVHRSKTGRILEVCSNQAFDAFATKTVNQALSSCIPHPPTPASQPGSQ